MTRTSATTLRGPRRGTTQLACITVLASTSWADAAGSSDAPAIQIEEVVVTAQKRQEKLQQVPISITVLGGDELDKSSFTSVMDALQTVPGVFGLSNGGLGGGTAITIRGVGAQEVVFSGSSPVGYYLDTMPFALIRDAITPDQNAFDLERVEVLRGPQGTLYGASSMNGLVRVLTKDANLNAFEVKARGTFSDTKGAAQSNYRGDLAVNVPIIEGKLAARGVVGYQDLSGWLNSPNAKGVNDEQVRSYRLKINAQPLDAFSIGLSAWTNRGSRGAPSASADGATIPETNPQHMANDFDTYGLKLGYDFAQFSVTSNTGYLHSLTEGNIDFGVGTLQTRFSSNNITQEILLSSVAGSPWTWSAGVFYRDAEEQLFQELPEFGILTEYIDTSKSAAVFGEVGHRFWNDKMQWTLGVRYFHDDLSNVLADGTGGTKSSFEATTPRAVLTWFPNEETTLYASYGQGFRSGLNQDPYTAAVAPGSFTDAKPDKLSNYEVGMKTNVLNNRLTIDTSVYYIDWQDVQQSLVVFVGELGVAGLTNGESASGFGIDLGMTARPLPGLDLGLTASWNDLTYDASTILENGDIQFAKGDRLIASPKYTLGASAAYGRPFAAGYEARLAVSANYISELTSPTAGFPAPTLQASDTILVGRARLSIDSPHRWTAALFVDNFNDERGATSPFNPAVANKKGRLRPRTIGVQLDYNF